MYSVGPQEITSILISSQMVPPEGTLSLQTPFKQHNYILLILFPKRY